MTFPNKTALSHMRESLADITVLTTLLRAKLKTLRDEVIRAMADAGTLPEDLAGLQACTRRLQEESSSDEEGCDESSLQDELERERARSQEMQMSFLRANTRTFQLEKGLAWARREVEKERVSFRKLCVWSAVLLALAWWVKSACG